MPSKRRGGFNPPELRGTLGTLLRTTTGVVRDALERGAREGRARLDDARANRRRHDALADLGELILDLIRRGEIDLAELPEARDLVRELDQLDNDTAAADLDAEPDLPRALSRRPFDDRSRGRGRADVDNRSRHTDADARPRRDSGSDDSRASRAFASDDSRANRAAASDDSRANRAAASDDSRANRAADPDGN